MITDALLFRFLNRETSKRENLIIRSWLSADPANSEHLNKLRKIFEADAAPEFPEQLHNDWTSVESKFSNKTIELVRTPSWSVRLIQVAAVFIILAGSAILWMNRSNTNVIRNRELATKSVYLPDGTEVDMGPGSKLVFSNDFAKGNRTIRLKGEAYFNVTSDPDHPFTVIAGSTRIKVTGTRFAVNAPTDNKEVVVTVKSGKVLFYNSDTFNKNSFRMGLVAGEQGIFDPVLNRMDKTRDPYFQTTP